MELDIRAAESADSVARANLERAQQLLGDSRIAVAEVDALRAVVEQRVDIERAPAVLQSKGRTRMKAETVNDLVINVDLKPSPRQSFDLQITWCVNCNLKAQAAALVAELKCWLDGHDVKVRLVEGANSVFNVQCNGQTVFDRISEGRFPMYHEVQLRMFRMFLKQENLKESTRQKWDRILAAKGLTWEQVFAK